jgi:hypothetical protein
MANWPWMTLVSGEVMYQNHRNDKNRIKKNLNPMTILYSSRFPQDILIFNRFIYSSTSLIAIAVC